MDDNGLCTDTLLDHYSALLDLYAELETASRGISQVLADGSRVAQLTALLRKNVAVAERIREESQSIAAMKKSLTDRKLLNEEDRLRVREAEKYLTEAVTRVVEYETKSQELMMKQGVKISRR